jgi:hypothetical protein
MSFARSTSIIAACMRSIADGSQSSAEDSGSFRWCNTTIAHGQVRGLRDASPSMCTCVNTSHYLFYQPYIDSATIPYRCKDSVSLFIQHSLSACLPSCIQLTKSFDACMHPTRPGHVPVCSSPCAIGCAYRQALPMSHSRFAD